MADTLNASFPTLSGGPYVGAVAINYSSDQTFTGVPRGIYLTTGGGSLKVDMANGTTVTLTSLITGTVYPFAIVKIYSSGSATAAGFVLF